MARQFRASEDRKSLGRTATLRFGFLEYFFLFHFLTDLVHVLRFGIIALIGSINWRARWVAHLAGLPPDRFICLRLIYLFLRLYGTLRSHLLSELSKLLLLLFFRQRFDLQ